MSRKLRRRPFSFIIFCPVRRPPPQSPKAPKPQSPKAPKPQDPSPKTQDPRPKTQDLGPRRLPQRPEMAQAAKRRPSKPFRQHQKRERTLNGELRRRHSLCTIFCATRNPQPARCPSHATRGMSRASHISTAARSPHAVPGTSHLIRPQACRVKQGSRIGVPPIQGRAKQSPPGAERSDGPARLPLEAAPARAMMAAEPLQRSMQWHRVLTRGSCPNGARSAQ